MAAAASASFYMPLAHIPPGEPGLAEQALKWPVSPESMFCSSSARLRQHDRGNRDLSAYLIAHVVPGSPNWPIWSVNSLGHQYIGPSCGTRIRLNGRVETRHGATYIPGKRLRAHGTCKRPVGAHNVTGAWVIPSYAYASSRSRIHSIDCNSSPSLSPLQAPGPIRRGQLTVGRSTTLTLERNRQTGVPVSTTRQSVPGQTQISTRVESICPLLATKYY